MSPQQPVVPSPGPIEPVQPSTDLVNSAPLAAATAIEPTIVPAATPLGEPPAAAAQPTQLPAEPTPATDDPYLPLQSDTSAEPAPIEVTPVVQAMPVVEPPVTDTGQAAVPSAAPTAAIEPIPAAEVQAPTVIPTPAPVQVAEPVVAPPSEPVSPPSTPMTEASLPFRKSEAVPKRRLQSGIALAAVGVVVVLALSIGIVLTAKHASALGQQHDRKVQADLRTLQEYLIKANTEAGSYPTLAQVNNPGWRAMHMQGVTPVTLSPNSSVLQLVSGKPTADAYAYNPIPAGCDGSQKSICSSYNLVTKLSNGKQYSMSP